MASRSSGQVSLRVGDLAALLDAVRVGLAAHRDEIDALNVFPIPDGDTGSNLLATASAAATAAAMTGDDAAVASRVVRAALRGARGNSGVIFSQVVRAVVEAMQAAGDAGAGPAQVLAAALTLADRYAREAVAEPVEGTILTVLTVVADVARSAAEAGDDVLTVLDAVAAAAADAVAATQRQLAVLTRAGVVDAGARGLEVALASLRAVVRDEPLPDVPPVVAVPRCTPDDARTDAFPYEVQCLVEQDTDAGRPAPQLRAELAAMGDSVVVVAAGALLSVHVHTDDVDTVLAAAARHGSVTDVEVTDLRADVAARQAALDRDATAIVAVLPAGGLADLGSATGAEVVAGAAGDLPSVGDVLDAITRVTAARVVVLPGHPNAVPTCRQAAVTAAEQGREIEVLSEAVHPLQVLAAASLGPATTLAELREAVMGCRVGEVVRAVRDGHVGDAAVSVGQWVAVVDGTAVAPAGDLLDALGRVLVDLGAAEADLVTCAVGADAGPDGLVAVTTVLAQAAPQAEWDVYDGGQRPAALLVAVE